MLSLLLAVPGEELFWRGITYRVGVDTLTTAGIAAVATCLLYVVANLPSRSLPIIAGAVVGGALWGALGVVDWRASWPPSRAISCGQD